MNGNKRSGLRGIRGNDRPGYVSQTRKEEVQLRLRKGRLHVIAVKIIEVVRIVVSTGNDSPIGDCRFCNASRHLLDLRQQVLKSVF